MNPAHLQHWQRLFPSFEVSHVQKNATTLVYLYKFENYGDQNCTEYRRLRSPPSPLLRCHLSSPVSGIKNVKCQKHYFIGGAVCREFESEALAAEEIYTSLFTVNGRKSKKKMKKYTKKETIYNISVPHHTQWRLLINLSFRCTSCSLGNLKLNIRWHSETILISLVENSFMKNWKLKC